MSFSPPKKTKNIPDGAQWLGGIGVIVMAIAIFPMLSVGGMQLFKTENFEAPEKVIPRATSLARGIFIIYSVLTLIWATLLYFSGMYAFDAILHSMTTIATGGYSTKTNSIGAFNSDIIDWVIIIGMIMGSLPFIHYLAITRGSFDFVAVTSGDMPFESIAAVKLAVESSGAITDMTVLEEMDMNKAAEVAGKAAGGYKSPTG